MKSDFPFIPHPNRGVPYSDDARDFIKKFPIGTTLTNEQFDQWAENRGALIIPKTNDGLPINKKSDAWLAHLTRRNQLRTNIYKASTHPSMYDGSECFVITLIGNGVMLVERPEEAAPKTAFAAKLDSLIGTKRRHLGYLMESLDMAQLPPWQQAVATNLYDELSGWNEVIHLQTKQFDRRMQKLLMQIKRSMDAGEVTPKNHGIQRLLEDKSDEFDESDE